MLWRILVVQAFVLASPAASAFDYFEHRYLGNRAYAEALRTVKEPLREALERVRESKLRFGWQPDDPNASMAARLLTRLPLQFGDLAALAGDFARDTGDLSELLKELPAATIKTQSRRIPRFEILIVNTRQQWLSACRWIHRVRIAPHGAVPGIASTSRAADQDDNACFDTLQKVASENGSLEDVLLLKAQPVHRFGAEGYRPSREELAERERIPRYVPLVAVNKKHFPRHSWKAYSDHHNRALELARCFRDWEQGCSRGRASREDLLVDAIIEEAFAQHYLQDSFAAGHIGTKWGECWFGDKFGCSPTKIRVQQTHDVLNELGVDVRLADPQKHLHDASKTVSRRWTSFGDDHLFIPAADFHRGVILRTATASIREVFEHAELRDRSQCLMCTTKVFPRPLEYESKDPNGEATDLTSTSYQVGDLIDFQETRPLAGDLRSSDPRVPGIPLEGWKVGAGIVWQFRDPDSTKYDGGAMLSLDYLRTTGDLWPNSYGFEFWNVPDRGTAYMATAGYVWPAEVATWQFTIKGKFGWRTEENFTKNNPDSSRRGGLQVTFPSLEVTYDVYRPVAVFSQLNVFTYVFRGGEGKSESIFKSNSSLVLLGVKVDLSKVI
jgi:hypothetical protein